MKERSTDACRRAPGVGGPGAGGRWPSWLPRPVRLSDGWGFVRQVRDHDGKPVRVLQTGGVYQSATYLDERRMEPVFSYYRAFDHAFTLRPDTRRVLMIGGGGYAWPKHVLERMRRVLEERCSYPFLMRNATVRLAVARRAAAGADIDRSPLINLGEDTWALFPWLGSYAFLALERLIKHKCAQQLGIKGLDPTRPYYLQFRMSAGPGEFFRTLIDEANKPFDPLDLLGPTEVPVFEKYDSLLPPELVRKGFAEGVLDVQGMRSRVNEWEPYATSAELPSGGGVPASTSPGSADEKALSG